jgi:hypothetical protein
LLQVDVVEPHYHGPSERMTMKTKREMHLHQGEHEQKDCGMTRRQKTTKMK